MGLAKAPKGRAPFVHRYPDTICIDQGALRGSRRSNPATYTEIFDPIRKLFAQANRVRASLFSANSDGACPNCKGLGAYLAREAVTAN